MQKNKRIIALLLALLVIVTVGLSGCKKEEVPIVPETPSVVEEKKDEKPEESNGSGLEEVKGVTIPSFEISVNGVAINQDIMAVYPVYSVQATSVNSIGTESTAVYIGFSFLDVLDAAGLKDKYVWVQAVADDGYAVTFNDDTVSDPKTLLAITKDGSPYASSPWFAPCSKKVSGQFLKNAVSILVNTVDGVPEMEHAIPGEKGEEAGEGLPEILDRTGKVEFAPFSFKVNGKEVTNETLAGLKIYKIAPMVTNNKGVTEERNYTGYKLLDVLNAIGAGTTNVKAVANDGFESVLTAEMISSDYTLLAIEYNKELGKDGTVFVAPCAQTTAGSYVKLVIEIITE